MFQEVSQFMNYNNYNREEEILFYSFQSLRSGQKKKKFFSTKSLKFSFYFYSPERRGVKLLFSPVHSVKIFRKLTGREEARGGVHGSFLERKLENRMMIHFVGPLFSRKTVPARIIQ